jgi:hypothetical protein
MILTFDNKFDQIDEADCMHIIFNVGTLSLEARNIRLVNIITYIIEESKLISENMSPNVIHG